MLLEIESPRLILRLICPDDYDFIFKQGDEAAIALLGIADMAALALEKEKYQKGLQTYNRSFCNFVLIEKSTNEVIGHCGFHTWYIDHRRAEIGYALKEEHNKSKGFMSEALPIVLAYGFEQMKLHRIEAFIGYDNEPSLRLVRRLGFIQEGHLKSHYFKHGKFEDSLVFALFEDNTQK
jgi:ribosomal-protein-alanine N-acetyltransferase